CSGQFFHWERSLAGVSLTLAISSSFSSFLPPSHSPSLSLLLSIALSLPLSTSLPLSHSPSLSLSPTLSASETAVYSAGVPSSRCLPSPALTGWYFKTLPRGKAGGGVGWCRVIY